MNHYIFHNYSELSQLPYFLYCPAPSQLHHDREIYFPVKHCYIGAEVSYTIKKNVPRHILAPSAVACDILHLRASAHLAGGFCRIGDEVSYTIKKPRILQTLADPGLIAANGRSSCQTLVFLFTFL